MSLKQLQQQKQIKKEVYIQAAEPTTPSKFPDKLVWPSSPIVPVKVENIYNRALLDIGAQVTLLYQDFNNKYLKHLQTFRKLEGLGSFKSQFKISGLISVNKPSSSWRGA